MRINLAPFALAAGTWFTLYVIYVLAVAFFRSVL